MIIDDNSNNFMIKDNSKNINRSNNDDDDDNNNSNIDDNNNNNDNPNTMNPTYSKKGIKKPPANRTTVYHQMISMYLTGNRK